MYTQPFFDMLPFPVCPESSGAVKGVPEENLYNYVVIFPFSL